MNLRARSLALALALAALAGAAQAQALKPGLWQMTSQTQSASGEMEKAMAEMQKQMAAMSPEQRKQMQDMMAKQGVSVGAGAGGGMQIKVCLTKEMVERNEVMGQQPGDCKTAVSPRSGSTQKMSFVCTKPPSSGEAEVRYTSPEAYSSRMTVRSSARGKEETMTINSQGQWLGAACGDIKPIGAK